MRRFIICIRQQLLLWRPYQRGGDGREVGWEISARFCSENLEGRSQIKKIFNHYIFFVRVYVCVCVCVLIMRQLTAVFQKFWDVINQYGKDNDRMAEKGCRGEYMYFSEKTQVAGRHSLAHNTIIKHTWGYRHRAIFFFKLGARWRWVIKATPFSSYPSESDTVPTVQ